MGSRETLSICADVTLILLALLLLFFYHRLLNQRVRYTLRKKRYKSVTGAVPFQKVNFCPF